MSPVPAATPTPTPSSRATQTPSPNYPPYPASDALTTQYAALGLRLPPLRTITRRSGADFPGFNVASDDAIPTWKKLRALTDKTGLYPLVVRDEHDYLANLDQLRHASPKHILGAADSIDVVEWLAQRPDELEIDASTFRKPGATSPANDRFVVPYDTCSTKPIKNVYIILLPTKDPCEVPAYFPNGGWNDCPNPEVQVAFLRHWHARYGTEPVTCSGDVWEYLATRRPADLDEALTLATEQFYFCVDIVDQGCESIDVLADFLMKSDIWFFWWD